MTKEEAIEKLKDIETWDDTEAAHCCADDVLCELLISLGYEDVVYQWGEIDKWYA
jgi:hypothetical protein